LTFHKEGLVRLLWLTSFPSLKWTHVRITMLFRLPNINWLFVFGTGIRATLNVLNYLTHILAAYVFCSYCTSSSSHIKSGIGIQVFRHNLISWKWADSFNVI
jgi:hypothetical protein